MWDVFKILVGALFILLLVSPIVVLVVKMARRIGQLVHEWQLSKAETEAAWAETRKRQIDWHTPDERGFIGILFDGSTGTWINADTGEQWATRDRKWRWPWQKKYSGLTDKQIAKVETVQRADSRRADTVNKQRLYASLAGVKVEKKDVQMIAGGGSTARFKVEAETLLNEPQRKTDD